MKKRNFFAAAFVATFAMTAPVFASCTTPSDVNRLASEVAQGLNTLRAANGLGQVAFDNRLGQAAMAHACDMSVNGLFYHASSDGSNVAQRVNATGFKQCLVVENIAWGFPNSEQILNGWMQSPSHRVNMLHPRVEEFGIAITNGSKGPNWVLVMASGC